VVVANAQIIVTRRMSTLRFQPVVALARLGGQAQRHGRGVVNDLHDSVPRVVEVTTMNTPFTQVNRYCRRALALLCVAAIASGNAWAQSTASIPADQLDSLVAPIALYPDPLLAQVLAASTYPLEIMQLQQWLSRNTGLKGKALADAVAQQPWDPSVQGMAALPDVVKHLADNIQWTTDLGNAFLAQQADVMHAVQRMRAKAQGNGSLHSTPQQTVQTQVIENEPVIVIEQASPDVVYVPSYQPTVVYGSPVYPYPHLTYDDDYPWGYAAGAAISFGAGVAMGAFWGHGGWGYRPGWGWGGDWDLNVNRNANFIRNTNIGTINRGAINNRWQHNPVHRGGTPYRDRATANRFGGTARGDSLANRQAGARQQLSRQGGNLATSRAPGTVGGLGDRQAPGSLGTRSGAGNLGDRAVGTSGQLGSRDFSRGGGQYPWQSGSRAAGSGGQLSSRDFSRGAGGADRIGQRDFSRGSGANAWGGGSFSSSQRGASSFQSRSGSSFRSGGSRSYGGGSRSFGGGSRSFGGGGRSFGGGGRSRGGGGRR
jgi:hypothetical protein